MSPEIVTILALVAIFAIATFLPINMGALAFVAAFLVGHPSVGLTTDEILGGFPAELVLTCRGHLPVRDRPEQRHGRPAGARGRDLVGGHVAAIPWIMFFVTALLTAIGALSPAAVAIVAPIALAFAAAGINPLLMGMMVVHGAQAGGFSPISVYGVTVNRSSRTRACRTARCRLPRQPGLQPGDRRWCCSSCSAAAGSSGAGRGAEAGGAAARARRPAASPRDGDAPAGDGGTRRQARTTRPSRNARRSSR